MIISHEFKNAKIESESNDPGFLITNRNGSYYSFSSNNSRYDGFFIMEKEKMYKVIDEILINKPIKKIINKFSHTTIERENLNQDVYLFKNLNSLAILLDRHSIIEFLLDVKESYDNRNFGRYYNISHEGNKIIVKFDKKTSSQDNEIDGNHEYSFYIVINQATFSNSSQWTMKSYQLDKQRKSSPYERYVFNGLKVITDRLIISASHDKRKAIAENDYIIKNINQLITKQEKYTNNLLNKFHNTKKDIDMAYKCAINSLDQLTTERGVFAGLPWFFQYWTRDELLCSKALAYINKNLSVQIINKYIEEIIKKNDLYSNQDSKLLAKDGIGLLIIRASEIKNCDYKLIQYLMNSIKEEFMIRNNGLETWMDTNSGNDSREGIRIEIQTLYLRLYSILYKLSKEKRYKIMEEKLKENVRKGFFTGKILKDGINDETIRPNIFLAYYYYPDLLTNKEWISIFDTSIPKIWDEWGGFSSIEKSSHLFQNNYTGEDNISYHRGDSWFFLNNLAAICLHRLDKNRYKKYITKILESSIKDTLWDGYMGFHSELSSSSQLKAEGCKAQSWSSAMFIELIKELKK
jgi:hypothetical protein